MPATEFKSSLIHVVPFEDDDVNPGILGRGLANWVKESLVDSAYPVSEDIAEDWGYCLMLQRKPYWLWVGCSGSSDYEYPEGELTPELASSFPLDTITWQLWVTSELGMISRLLGENDSKRKKEQVENILMSKLELLNDLKIL